MSGIAAEPRRIGSLVVYPRGYDVARGEAFGVDAMGNQVAVRLEVPGLLRKQVASGKGELPSVERLADTGRRAKNPCLASPDNSAAAPRGVLLCERCTEQAPGMVSAGWMSVLRSDELDPLPVFGTGYLDVSAWRAEDADPAPPGPDGTPASGRAARHGERYRFSAVVLRPDLAKVVVKSDFVAGGRIQTFLERASVRGRYGGVILRPVFQGRYRRDACVSAWIRYDRDSGLCTTPAQALREAAERRNGRLKKMLDRDDVTLHALPAFRVAAGPRTNSDMTSAMVREAPSKVEKIWLDERWHQSPLAGLRRTQDFLATPIALRCARTRDGASELLSAIHAMGAPIGDALSLGMDAAATAPQPQAMAP